MSVNTLLSKLERVRPTGPGRWIARCPAHVDRTPSLSIRELDDGRVLLHDFGQQCRVEDIVAELGLALEDLFPHRPIEHASRVHRPFLREDAFFALQREAGVVAIIAADMHKHRTIDDESYERLFVAVEQLEAIADLAYGR